MHIEKRAADLSMMTELYEFSLADGYFTAGMQDTVACFDLFFRRVPDNGGFAVMAGLEQVIEYLKNLHFSESDLEFLREKGISEGFIAYLRDFKFACLFYDKRELRFRFLRRWDLWKILSAG